MAHQQTGLTVQSPMSQRTTITFDRLDTNGLKDVVRNFPHIPIFIRNYLPQEDIAQIPQPPAPPAPPAPPVLVVSAVNAASRRTSPRISAQKRKCAESQTQRDTKRVRKE